MGRRPSIFYNTLRKLLDERLDQLRSGETPRFTDVRHLFYETRNRFLRENPDFDEPDSRAKQLYSDFGGQITNYLQDHCEEFGISPTTPWLLRDKMQIYAQGTSICQSSSGESVLMDYRNRKQHSENCSFILVCEKATIIKELVEALREKDYVFKVVGTGGFTPNDVKEAIIQSNKEHFYIFHLHDYDLEGYKIYFDLKQHFQQILDVGVNQEFLSFLKDVQDLEYRYLEETNIHRKQYSKLREIVVNQIYPDTPFTLEDYEYLEGSEGVDSKGKRVWIGKRMELDAIHVEHGITPFVEYLLQIIEDKCDAWNLRNIGFEDYVLEEPPNHYENAIQRKQEAISEIYGKKRIELSENLNIIYDLLKDILTLPREFSELRKQHLGKTVQRWVITEDGTRYSYDERPLINALFQELVKENQDAMDRLWRGYYEDRLSDVNDQLDCYEGDITQARTDLDDQFDDVQNDLETAKEDDPQLQDFKDALDEIDFGEEDLEEIEIPTLKEDLVKVIQALQTKLEETS